MAQEPVQLQSGSTVGRFRIEKKLGQGAFGAVYKVVDRAGAAYALNVENFHATTHLLQMEARVLSKIKDHNTRHFCQIVDKGSYPGYVYVVMTMVGQSLKHLRKAARDRKLSMGCAISVGSQCLEALEDMHRIGYLHRDIKPDNFAVGRREMNELRKVYLLDFGMCREFVRQDGIPRTSRETVNFRGTARYASINTHKLMELSPKDDLESWLYQQVKLTKGALPWRNVQQQEEILKYKESCRTSVAAIEELFRGCPPEYAQIYYYIDSLGYYDAPNYQDIYRLMRSALTSTHSKEYPYDWE